MADPTSTEADHAALTRQLGDLTALRALMADHAFLRSEDDARDYLRAVLRGLDDIRQDRTVSHDEVVRAANARRRSRATAAE